MSRKILKIEKSMLFLILMFFIIIVTSIIVVSALQVNPVEEMIKNEEPIKILFVLEDKGDVLFSNVFVYYPISQQGALFSIPGNTGAIYSSIGRVDRIDSVFKEKGIDVFRMEIENLLGQKVPFSVVCSVENFKILTDMLGGFRIFVPFPVDILDENGNRWLLPSGFSTLDGEKLYTYLYYKSAEESSGAVLDRYQNVMVAFLSALNKNSTMMFDGRNFNYFSKFFTSNIETKYFKTMLESISHVDSERIAQRTVTGLSRVVDGKTLLMPLYDGEELKNLFKLTVTSLVSDSDTLYDRIYVLEIQNGTTVQGLARNTAIHLQGYGYDVLSTVNADSNDYEKTVIINHIGNDEVAKTLGDIIMCDNIVTEEILPDSAGLDSAARVDFTIILGKDFDGRYVR